MSEPSRDSRRRLTTAEYQDAFGRLRAAWREVMGEPLASITEPYMFSGRKRRKLVVVVRGTALPPWGSWQAFSPVEAERRTFTGFRQRVNDAIAPHAVDHVVFWERPEP
jgi:hypothetical protein